MKKLKEIARLLLECNLGIRPIARACNDLFFMVLDKIRYFSENTFGYNCIQEDIRT